MPLLEDFDEVREDFERLVAGTPRSALEDPTPCSGWTVRLLLNHVITGTQWFAALFAGEPAPDRETDQVLDDPLGAFRRRADEFRAAMAVAGALEGRYLHPIGEQAGSTFVMMRMNEFIVHGWDLAQATGQTPVFPERVILSCLEMYRPMLDGRPREPGRAFGVEQSPPPDATPLQQLVAFFGRVP